MNKEFASIEKRVNKVAEMADQKDMLNYDGMFVNGEYMLSKRVSIEDHDSIYNYTLFVQKTFEDINVVCTTIIIFEDDIMYSVDYFQNSNHFQISKFNTKTEKMTNISMSTFVNHLNKFKSNLK